MGEVDRLEYLYGQNLGGGLPVEPPPSIPLPEGADPDPPASFGEKEPVPVTFSPLESRPNGVNLKTGEARLEGFNIVLQQNDISAIIKIIAKAISSEAERNLNEWRERFSLQQEG